VQLLRLAYPALLILSDRYNRDADKEKLLDKMLREGIFSAFFHSREHVRIVEVLASEASQIVEKMGIHAVKHLKVCTDQEQPLHTMEYTHANTGSDTNVFVHSNGSLCNNSFACSSGWHRCLADRLVQLLASVGQHSMARGDHKNPRPMLAACEGGRQEPSGGGRRTR